MATGWYNGGVEDKYMEFADVGGPQKSGDYVFQGYKFNIPDHIYDAWRKNRYLTKMHFAVNRVDGEPHVGWLAVAFGF